VVAAGQRGGAKRGKLSRISYARDGILILCGLGGLPEISEFQAPNTGAVTLSYLHSSKRDSLRVFNCCCHWLYQMNRRQRANSNIESVTFSHACSHRRAPMNRPAPASLQFSLTLPRTQTHHLRFIRTDAGNMPLRDTASTIESGLTAAFAFLAPASASWALSYLLDLSPPNALATLSSPPSTSAAVAALCVETTFEVASIGTTPTSPNSFISPRGAFDASLTFDGLFVPAFSASGISVGVIVNRLGPAPLPPISHSTTAPIHFAVGRYARSNVTGELLAVKRSATMPGIAPGPTPGLSTIPSVQIIHLHLRGPCRRARATYVIEEAAWAAGIRPGAASGVDLPALSQAVSMVLRCEETRHCARCGAPAAAACG
jgi:hypothetical protein